MFLLLFQESHNIHSSLMWKPVCNSYLKVERFLEQYPAIQAAAALDPRLRKAMTKDNLQHLKDEGFQMAEEFNLLMKILYTSTPCVSCENNPINPIIHILYKLEEHFTVKDEDTMFVSAIKEKMWESLSILYWDENIQAFQHETTSMDPRFKGRLASNSIGIGWGRVVEANVTGQWNA